MPPTPSSNFIHADQAIEDIRMNFGDHLEELRKRLLRALIGCALTFAITLYYGSPIVVWLLKPLISAQRQAGITPMTYAGITSGFTTYVLVAAAAAIIISSPWVLYQLWQFVAAGLYPTERRMIVTVAPLSGLMSVLGVSFLYYFLLPMGLFFLLSFTASYPQIPQDQVTTMSQVTTWFNRMAVKFSGMSMHTRPPVSIAQSQPASEASTTQPSVPVQIPVLTVDPEKPVEGQIWLKQPEGEVRISLHDETRTLSLTVNSLITPLIQVSEYLTFVAYLGLGVVLAFQLPVLMLILAWTGLVKASTFKPYRRHILLACFVIAAVLPPPDPLTMTMMALPLYLLFELGLILMTLAGRSARLRGQMHDAEESA